MQIQMHSQLKDQVGSILFSILQFESQHNIYTPQRVVIQAIELPLY